MDARTSPPRASLQFVAVVTLCLVALSGVAAGDGAVEEVEVAGPGTVDGDGNQSLLAPWRPTTATVTLAPAADPAKVCVSANTSATGTTLACEPVGPGDRQTLRIAAGAWPAVRSEPVTLVGMAVAPNGSEVGRAERPVAFVGSDGVAPTATRTDPLGVVTDVTPASATPLGSERLTGPVAAEQRLADAAVRAHTEPSFDRVGPVVGYTNATRSAVTGPEPRVASGVASERVELPLVPLVASVRWVVAAALVAGVVLGATAVAVAERVATGTQASGSSQRPVSTPARRSGESEADRVHRLLAANGGCLPQSELVERTEWSKSKVSRLLSEMAADDQIRKVRVGRENLVVHPDATPPEQPPE